MLSMKGAAQRVLLKVTRAKTQHVVHQSKRGMPSSTTFQAHFVPKYNPNMHMLPWVMEDQSNLLFRKARDDASKRAREGLWWNIMAPMSTSAKRTVRSWTRRRLATAMIEVLLDKGYDAKGMTVGWNQDIVPANDLVGSLRLMTNARTVTAPKSLINSEMHALVDRLCLSSNNVPARSALGDYTNPTALKSQPTSQRSEPKQDYDEYTLHTKLAAVG